MEYNLWRNRLRRKRVIIAVAEKREKGDGEERKGND
jgi:hypothetical protein